MNRSLNSADQQSVSDLELLTASGSGDASAFRTLYRRYERRVYNYARTFLSQDAAAEDVVIETMTAVWQGARTFTGASRASTWILGIARHKAIDAVRKGGGRAEPLSLDDAEEPLSDEDPSASIEQHSASESMLRAIANLSADHREILRLAFYEDLQYEEIASLLAIPENTVKTRVFYAKQQLKRHLLRLGSESTQ